MYDYIHTLWINKEIKHKNTKICTKRKKKHTTQIKTNVLRCFGLVTVATFEIDILSE